MTNLEERLNRLGDVLDEHYGPIALHELAERFETHGDRVTLLDLRERDESAARPPWTRRALIGAPAAALLLVVGLVVVDRDRGDEVSEPASTPTAPGTIPSPSAADPGVLPSVLDPVSGYRWSQLPYDEAIFGEEFELGMNSVTVGGPGLVAVGGAGSGLAKAAVWTSFDGITWSRIPGHEDIFDGSDDQWMNSVTAGGPGLVAVGVGAFGANDGAVVWTSVDGLTWSRVPHDEAVFGGSAMTGVTVGGPGLVAVGWDGHPHGEESNAVVWTSVDGLTWSRVPHDEAIFGATQGAWMWSVVAGGPGLVAVGDSTGGAAVWTSVDGLTWSRVTHDEAVFGNAGMRSVAVGGPGLVAVGNAGDDAAVWTSVDGLTWSRVTSDESIFGGPIDQGMTSVTAAGSGLVAVGSGGVILGSNGDVDRLDAAVWTSVDGISWSRVAHDETVFGAQPKPIMDVRSIIAGGPGLVAVGSNRVYVTSGATDSETAVWVASLEN